MTATGSPSTGASNTEQWPHLAEDGRRYRVEQYSAMVHDIDDMGTLWEVAPGHTGGVPTLWVFEPEVSELDDEGMSTRAIAPIVGADQPTVTRDLARDASASPATEPRQITGRDGKTHSTSSEPVPKVPSGVPRKLLYAEVLAAGRPDLTDAEYRLLMAMWKYADNTTLGDIYPGHARLVEQVGLAPTKNNRDSIGRRISSLIQKGYVVRVREGATVPRRRAAEYRLTLPEWEEGTESTAVSGTR